MVTLELEKKIFHVVLENRSYLKRVHPSFFDNKDIGLLFRFAKAFMKKYPDNKPTMDQLLYFIQKKGLDDQLTVNKVETIWEAQNRVYEDEWNTKTVQGWIMMRSLEYGYQRSGEYFRSQSIDEENVNQICNETLKIFNNYAFVSFHTDVGVDIFNPEAHVYDKEEIKKSIGFPFLDTVSGGGISPGELWILAGEPNVGKSIWLANLAKSAMEQGSNVVYVSLEMGREEVLQRIGSNMFNIEMDDYFNTTNDISETKKIIAKYKQEKSIFGDETLGNLYIENFPTSDLDVPSLQSWVCENIEKNYDVKIDIVVVDYINILSNWRNPNSENTYMAIKQLSQDLRGMAKRNEWGVISATQLKVGAFNSTDVQMSDIGESSGLSHTIDLGCGIIQNDLMHANRKYILKVLKNRTQGYKNVKKEFDINYDYMRLSESESPIEQGS